MRVLITGGLGWTAAAIIAELEKAGHQVLLFDLPAAAKINAHPHRAVLHGDVADYRAVRAAVGQAEGLVHLAVATGAGAQDPRTSFRVNVEGTYNLFEAARSTGVSRLVAMSEAPVHIDGAGGQEWQSSPGQDHLYDLTKRLQEEIARDFCATYNMTATVLRPGHIVDGRTGVDPRGRPLTELSYCKGGWICRHDLARACRGALETATTGFSALPVIGARPGYQRFDVARTERLLDFRVECDFAAY